MTARRRRKPQGKRLVHVSESLYGAGMPETAVPYDPVPQAAVPVPRKTPVPEAWKLAECLVPFRGDAVAVSTTVSTIWISVTR